jgi:methionine sulfoxide reductase catalytic subunit
VLLRPANVRAEVVSFRYGAKMSKFSYPIPPESHITPKEVFLNRRCVLSGLGASFGLFAVPSLSAELPDFSSGSFSTNETITSEDVAKGYCNFFEFGPAKDDPIKYSKIMQTNPWEIKIDGLVDKPRLISVDEILNKFALEERIYRLRCVEAWSMVIPWVGFGLADLLTYLGIRADARYVVFESIDDTSIMPTHAKSLLKWPYTEALRIDEAMHPLTFIAVGMYGDVLPNQNGAPIRLVVPWKYGFKSLKSIRRISLVSEQPATTWNQKSPREYGFYANVNPKVRHPRWHQATERRLHDGKRIRTEMFNGYGDLVGDLYAGMDLEKDY